MRLIPLVHRFPNLGLVLRPVFFLAVATGRNNCFMPLLYLPHHLVREAGSVSDMVEINYSCRCCWR